MSIEEDLLRIIQRHEKGLWRYLRLLGCEQSLCDDLVQEAFVALMHRENFEYRGEAAMGAYLRMTAKNLFLGWLRRTRKEVHVEDINAADTLWEASAGIRDGDEQIDALKVCVEELEARDRHALTLRYKEGLSYNAIAEGIDLGTEGVKALFRRLRPRLKECVERRMMR